MSINVIPTFQVQQYSTNVNLLLQQRGSKLANAVMTGNHVGKQASPVDQVGAVTAQKVTDRFAPMPRVDAPTDRRWVFPIDYDLPQQIDSFDKLRLITNPESVYALNASYAMGVAKDDEIIAALFGDAKTGEAGATSTAFPTGNEVSVNVGGTASNLNLAKIREARRLLMANQVDFDNDEIFIAVTSTEHDSLFNEVQVTSKDFTDSSPVFDSGRILRVFGMNVIPIERLTTGTDDQAGTSRQIPVWARSGMYLGSWQDVKVTITQRDDLRGMPIQIYVVGTFGATRLEEKKVMKIWAR